MKKQLKTLGMLLGILTAECLLLVWLVEYDPGTEQKEQVRSNFVMLLEKPAADISAVSVRTEQESYRIYRQDEKWEIQDYENAPLEQTLLEQVADAAAWLYAEKMDEPQNAETYGMDQIRAQVTVEWPGGNFIFQIGADAPANAGVYIRVAGKQEIYLLRDNKIRMLLQSPLSYFSRNIMEGFLDRGLPDRAVFKGETIAQTIEVRKKEGKSSYELEGNKIRKIDGGKVEELLTGILSAQADAAVEYRPDQKYETDEIFEKYAVTELWWDTEDGKYSIRLIASKPEDGKCFLLRDDNHVIYRVEEQRIPWLHLKNEDLLTSLLLVPDIGDVRRIRIEGNEKEEVFEVEADVGRFWNKTGKSIDAARFKEFYRSLIGIPAQEHSEYKPEKQAEVLLKIVYEYIDGRPEDVVELVEGPPLWVYLRINGNTEFLTNKKNLDVILHNLDVLSGEGDMQFYY